MATAPPVSESGSDTLANALLPSLIAGKVFALPTVDLDGEEYEVPSNPPAIVPAQLVNDDFTTRVVGGDGTFDAIMASTAAHLKAEYDKGRITGEQYTRAYIELTQAALSAGVQFLLGRDQAYWQSVNSQLQAQVVQLQIVDSRINLQISKTKLNMIQYDALTAEANYALAKLKLATEDAQHSLLKTQNDGLIIENDTKAYNLSTMLPQEVAIKAYNLSTVMPQEVAIKDYNLTTMLPQEVAIKNYNLTTMLPQEVAIKDYNLLTMMPQEVAIKDYNLNTMLPQEVAIKAYNLSTVMPQEVAIKDYNLTTMLPQEVAIKDYNLLTMMPQEVAIKAYNLSTMMPQEVAIKAYNLSTMLPQEVAIKAFELNSMLPKELQIKDAQMASMAKDNLAKDYNLSHMLPKQLEVLEEQILSSQKENQIRTYNLTTMMPKQLALLEEQIQSSVKDGLIKTYNLEHILPTQKTAALEQVEQVRAQTLDTRTNGTTVSGVIGKQKALYTQQITSYQRDAEVKAGKIFADAWVTMKTIDEGLLPPTGFTNSSLDTVLSGIKNNIGFGSGGGSSEPAGPIMTGVQDNGNGTSTVYYSDGSNETTNNIV